ncbi:MAG TPA: response regulator transcription factor [bacterium]|nr:response regulator transcription factor [bacterium]
MTSALTPVTIVLADDHHVVRQGLRAVLEAEPDFSILGEAGDGLEAVDLVAQSRPRVLIADLMMPGITGLEVTRRVRKEYPDTQVVILSMHASEPYVLEALRNGAAAYVLKASQSAHLVEAVRAAAAGHRYLSPSLSSRAIAVYADSAPADPGPSDGYATLTNREREVLHLAAEGHGHRAIGQRLGISPRTAEVHRANLMRKLDLHNQTDLVRYAIRRGIVTEA